MCLAVAFVAFQFESLEIVFVLVSKYQVEMIGGPCVYFVSKSYVMIYL